MIHKTCLLFVVFLSSCCCFAFDYNQTKNEGSYARFKSANLQYHLMEIKKIVNDNEFALPPEVYKELVFHILVSQSILKE